MCETYDGLVDNLDYKSIRYQGHAALMNFLLHELLMREDRLSTGKLLVNTKPPVNDDVVFIHASVEGWTAAASICAVVEMVNSGALPDKGFVKQEEIPLKTFFATHNGRLYDGQSHGGKLA